jgi:hypothetical protein
MQGWTPDAPPLPYLRPNGRMSGDARDGLEAIQKEPPDGTVERTSGSE